MKTVYVVTTGSYSDYGIDCMFSTREKAQEYIDLFPHEEYNDIEEYTLDSMNAAIARKKRGLAIYVVDMLKDGNTLKVWKREDSSLEHQTFIKYFPTGDRSKPQGFYLNASVWAKDEKHAVKIVNETRVMYIASNTWQES